MCGMRLSAIALLGSALLACTPSTAQARPRAEAPTTPVSTLYPSILPSIALIEVEGRDLDVDMGQVTAAGGVGSGVLISADGQVLTAAHVVQTADRVRVYFLDNDPIDAKVVRSDPEADVALLQLARVPAAAKPAPLGNSDTMQVGDEVFVVGAPLGLSHTLTVGHLSARRRPDALVTGLSNAELFQTDAAINQGNSGGPLFNMKGEVIGVVSHIISLTGGFEGLGFAVTSNAARELVLQDAGFWSGISGYRITPRMARIFNVPRGGILVEVVAKGSPAERLGLRGGDVSLEIGNETIVAGGDVIVEVQGLGLSEDAGDEVRRRLAALRSGETLTVKVMRAGTIVSLHRVMP